MKKKYKDFQHWQVCAFKISFTKITFMEGHLKYIDFQIYTKALDLNEKLLFSYEWLPCDALHLKILIQIGVYVIVFC